MTRLIHGVVAILTLFRTISPASAYSCNSFFVEVSVQNVTQRLPFFQYPFPDDGYAAVAFSNALIERDPPPTNIQSQSFSGSFNISAEHCTPDNPGTHASTVQFLTHGFGFDRSYWDFRLPNATNDTQYSYINTALEAGYSTFAWDRLGCGQSESPDPYLEVQSLIELAVLEQLTRMLRSGDLTEHGIPVPTKVFHVGHSFGSELSNALAGLPNANNLTDGVVLTSFSATLNYTSYLPTANIIKTAQPDRFANRSTGDFTWASTTILQYGFFAYPYFDPAALEYAWDTRWPVAVGEIITQPLLNFTATGFRGPVLWQPAEHDLLFCKGNCVGLFGPGSAAMQAFEGNPDVEVKIHPSVGHAINQHYNATGAFDVVQDWAMRHGF